MSIVLIQGAMKLKLDWANHKAAEYACKTWHYSKCLPAGKLVKIGVWEDEKFIGVVIFSRGACSNLPKLFKLKTQQVCELARVALTKHITPVTKIVSIALKMLKKFCPDLIVVVSYADRDQGHEGVIYKAGNWIEHGEVFDKHMFINRKKHHPRSIFSKYNTKALEYLKKNVDPNACYIETKGKIRFVYYLKRVISEKVSQQSFQIAEGGAVPTITL